MEERLRFIFANVNEWLKFAEAKNGVLIAFNGAAIFGILQSLEEICKINERLEVVAFVVIVTATVGIGIAFFSFMPSLNLNRKASISISPSAIGKNSLIFFRHISKFSPDLYLRTLYQRDGQSVQTLNPIELDLAHQIVENSKTTWLKYRLFFFALNVTLFGMILPIPVLIIYWITKAFKND